MKQLPDIENRADKHFDGSRVVLASENVYSYYFCNRAKKSAPWIPVAFARAPGDCSPAHAAHIFADYGFVELDRSVTRLMAGDDWHDYQVRQHLKAVGIKSTREPKRLVY